MRVMIVDNDEAWTRSLTILLTGHGYDIQAFTDPIRACDFIRQVAEEGSSGKMPDAVVLDYVMPGMNGLQVLARIERQLGPGCRVILMTGHGEQLRNAPLSEMGVASCLEKPVDLDSLEQALKGEV